MAIEALPVVFRKQQKVKLATALGISSVANCRYSFCFVNSCSALPLEIQSSFVDYQSVDSVSLSTCCSLCFTEGDKQSANLELHELFIENIKVHNLEQSRQLLLPNWVMKGSKGDFQGKLMYQKCYSRPRNKKHENNLKYLIHLE